MTEKRMLTAREYLVATMTEAQLSEYIRVAVKDLGGLMFHTHDSRHSAAGWPDNAIWVPQAPDQLVLAELKREGKDLDTAQEEWMQALLQVRYVTWQLWRPSDWLSGHVTEVMYGRR